MGSWKLAAVALTRSRLEESLDYGRMTQGCRLLCRLVCSNFCFQLRLLPPTALLPLTTVCFFALHKSRSKVKCTILIEFPRQGVYNFRGQWQIQDWVRLVPSLSCGEPSTNRLRMCKNFTENCVICILSVNSNFQVHATSLR